MITSPHETVIELFTLEMGRYTLCYTLVNTQIFVHLSLLQPYPPRHLLSLQPCPPRILVRTIWANKIYGWRLNARVCDDYPILILFVNHHNDFMCCRIWMIRNNW